MSAQPVPMHPHPMVLENRRLRARIEYLEEKLDARALKIASDTEGLAVLARLTPREVVIVAMILSAATNEEIARRTDTTAQTVRNRLRAVYAKVNVGGRLELAVYVWRHPALRAGLRG